MTNKIIKVIKILSEYEVVINAGKRDGIEEDDKFDIISQEKRRLEDPDTHEVLDEFDSYKAVVIANSVREKYSICKTPSHFTKGLLNTQIDALSNLSILSSTTVQEKLNVSEYDIDNIFEKYNDPSPVIEGDHVVKIEE